MRYEEVEKSGDFSVKEFLFSLCNQNNKHEVSMVKNVKNHLHSRWH